MAEITNELHTEVPASILRDAAFGAPPLRARAEVIALAGPRPGLGPHMNPIYGMHAGRDARLDRIARRLGRVGTH